MEFSEAIWNKTFLLFSMISLHLDPLFFYISYINATKNCLAVDHNLKIALCLLRTFADLLYLFHTFIHFWSANTYYFHDLLGLNIRSYDWGRCYRKAHFVFDLLVSLPLPQLALLVIIPNLDESFMMRHLLKLIIICQFVPRVIWLSLLYQRVTKIFGLLNGNAWAGAALNFFVIVLASHVVGALWYLFAIESQLRCWSIACERENSCDPRYLHCGERRRVDFGFLRNSCPLLERNQIKDSTNFDFGIFFDALQTHMLETSDLPRKLLYCSWWGLQTLSSLGQGLKPSSYYGEILFSYVITVIGLILLALIIGNMQKHLQTFSHQTLRLVEMKEARRDAEELMLYVSLPEELRQRVRRYEHYKRTITRGIELDTFVRYCSRERQIWAVECIQGAWRSHCRRKQEEADYIEAAWRRWRQKRNLE